MSISIVIEDAEIVELQDGRPPQWVVKHPNNGAILAYCDFKEEAVAVREAINDIARQLRDPEVCAAHGLKGV